MLDALEEYYTTIINIIAIFMSTSSSQYLSPFYGCMHFDQIFSKIFKNPNSHSIAQFQL